MARGSNHPQPPRDPRQLSLDHYFELPQPDHPTPGSLNIGAELCSVLSDELAAARTNLGLSRDMVAARMSDLTQTTITVSMLDGCVAKSHDRHRFPFEWALAFEEACQTTGLGLLYARKRGIALIGGEELRHARVARIDGQMARLREERARLLRGRR